MAAIIKQKEKELQMKEFGLVQRELHLMIQQQAPTPKKRRGHFSLPKLRKILNKKPVVSSPIGKCFYIRSYSPFYLPTRYVDRWWWSFVNLFVRVCVIFARIDFRHQITVQQTVVGERKSFNMSVPNSPPASPSIPRLHIASKWAILCILEEHKWNTSKVHVIPL